MKTIFLDRDGVINEDFGYVHLWQDFNFIEGSLEALQLLTKNDFHIIIITNQAGIAKGLYSEIDFNNLTSEFLDFCINNEVKILDTFFCPHHIDGVIPKYSKACKNRKPESGMFLKASKKYDIDLKSSIMVGDNITDIMASTKAGIKENYLVNNTKLNTDIEKKINFKIKKNLLKVTDEII